MNSISIGLALVALVAVAGWALLRRSAPGAGVPAAAPPRAAPRPQPVPATPERLPEAALQVPEELARLRLLRPEDLAPERRASYVSVFRDVPRPSRLLQQLLSPDFVNNASSAQLADLIRPEPLLAAKVLAAVNSPMYGLQRPVAGIDQAVVYLGVDTVRSVCLQYILIASFKTDRPECQRLLDTVWSASALASEMTRQLAQDLALESRGALVSAVVLSFLGRLATVAATPAGILATIPPRSLLERKDAEQRKLGLSASEIGRLLMTDWGLPPEVTADAADVDRVLTGAEPGLDPLRMRRLALCYLCARLGERLAHGELARLSDFDLATDPGLELFHLRSQLDPAVLARLCNLLKSPVLGETLGRMLKPARA